MKERSEKIEAYEKRFGNIAVNKGFITAEQLVEALRTQVYEELEQGTHKLLGEILMDLGFMNGGQVEQVVKEVLKAADD